MKNRLTEKDKLILWALTRCPDLSDSELSKKIGVKRRTFTAVKIKLKNNGIFSNILIPDLNSLGCEILSVGYGSFNPLTKFEDRKEGLKRVMECENIVYTFTTTRTLY